MKAINATVTDNCFQDKFSQHKFTEEEHIQMKDIVNVLSGFFEATKQFSVDNFVTISTVLPVYNCLLQSMTVDVSDSGMMSFLKKILRYYIAKYMTKYIVPNEKLFAAAMFLDIRTKLFGRHNESDKKR